MIRGLLTAAYLLLLAALWLLPADARMHHPARGHRIVASGGASPLDGFTTPSGAYSFRKLKSTYAGSAVRIRRASDNAELDINFLGCTGFTGCPWDAAAATAHCAATTCFGRAWYDQSGNVWDLVQTTTANQPQLIFNCNGSLPCFQFTSATQILSSVGNFTPATGLVSIGAVANRSVGTTGACVWLRQSGAGTNRMTANTVAASWLIGPGGAVSVAAADAAWHAGVAVLSPVAGQSLINVDGVEVTGTSAPVTTVGVTSVAGAATTTCQLSESIFRDNLTWSPAERATLLANQKSYYGTP